ncbi:MAG TPA: PQQ-binding-like beta-propeller repeat protein, partial [Thermomicrobiales bacterium]|nr:PQQ-binding-like beta-propeller repeat protein [Thermomicrobiales bacterium]
MTPENMNVLKFRSTRLARLGCLAQVAILILLFCPWAQASVAAQATPAAAQAGRIERRWSTPDCADLGSSQFVGSFVICAGDSGIRAYDPATGARAWTFKESRGGSKLPPVVSGASLIQGVGSEVVAVYSASGRQEWSATVAEGAAVNEVRPSSSGSIVFVRTNESIEA